MEIDVWLKCVVVDQANVHTRMLTLLHKAPPPPMHSCTHVNTCIHMYTRTHNATYDLKMLHMSCVSAHLN